MYQLSVAMEGVQWAFLFENEADANAAFEQCASTTHVRFTDSFGQTLMTLPQHIKAVQLEDLQKSRLAFVQRQLHQWRCSMDAQKAGQSDQALKAHAMQQQARPSLVSPFPQGMAQ